VAQYDRTKCTLHGSDQGFHEYALYTGLLSDRGLSARLLPAGSGQVNSLAALRGTYNHRSGTGAYDPRYHRLVQEAAGAQMRVLNMDGSLSPVVHQFDRFHALARWARHWATA